MSAGCARRVMRKHILRIFCALKARIFPTFFSCSSSARKKHMACSKKHKAYIFDVYKTLFLRCLEKAIFCGIFGRIFWVGR